MSPGADLNCRPFPYQGSALPTELPGRDKIILPYRGRIETMARKKLLLLKIKKKDRVLIIAPHPDDDVLGAGGLMAYFLDKKIFFKVIYICTGDGVPAFLWREKKFKFSPENYIGVGNLRRKEALRGLKMLGADSNKAIFLGYSDGCLLPMWKNPQKTIIGSRTRLTFSPYSFAYTENQEFKGVNLLADLISIFRQEKPTMVLAPHLKSGHLDHRAAFSFTKKVLEKVNFKGQLFEYLTSLGLIKLHGFLGIGSLIKIYPPKNKKGEANVLYPPTTLSQNKQWVSFWLSPDQIKKKQAALQAHQSQWGLPTLRRAFRSLAAQNEIFQKNGGFN